MSGEPDRSLSAGKGLPAYARVNGSARGVVIRDMRGVRRIRIEGHPVFVTLVTHGRLPWLAAPGCVPALLNAMRRVRTMYPFRHLAHVILPDHVHWMFDPMENADFSRIVAATKREVTWRAKQGAFASPPLWQDRFYDHVIRDATDLQRHLDYVHFNPVKHRVATMPIDYAYSSFREWVVRGAYSADWGASEEFPEAIRGMECE